jgi:hypothetical protein
MKLLNLHQPQQLRPRIGLDGYACNVEEEI